ncbi:MAG: hypothetical protein HFE77_00735 [Clostridiales bacterium]|nr:hypothetical protein [Clostridiales bacterium]
MKQKIALLLTLVLAVSMMSLIGCKKTGEEIEPSTSEPTQAPTEPSETTPPATDPTEDYKNDIAYYPFPLLNMTYEEIMKKYPDAVVEGGIQGTAILTCAQIPGIEVIFSLGKEYDEIENPILWDLLPCNIEVTENVYPGVQVGMKHGEIDFDALPNHELNVGSYQDLNSFIIYEKIQVDNYIMYVNMGSSGKMVTMPWEIVEKYLGYKISHQELFEQAIKDKSKVIQPEDIQNWLQNGHMNEIADLEITSIEIYRN